MNRLKRVAWLVLVCVFCACALAACSSKKDGGLTIFSDDNGDAYQTAALKHFSNVSWAKTEFMDAPLELVRENNGSVSTMRIGGISENTRYVVVISDAEEVLDRSPIEGKRYSVFVYDNGNDDIKVSLRYNVGTTENCVAKGNVVSGEFVIDQSLVIPASEVSDSSKRADVIFDTLYAKLVDIEGK